MSQELAEELCKKYTEITGIECKAYFMKKGQKHRATTLEKDKQGVYVFLLNKEKCFKVGKAGNKSQARWNSHHYNLDKKSTSTFTKSFITDCENFKIDFKDNGIFQEFRNFLLKIENEQLLKEEREKLKSWIQNNISRIEFKISSNESSYALDLLEKYIAFKLNPIYEG